MKNKTYLIGVVYSVIRPEMEAVGYLELFD